MELSSANPLYIPHAIEDRDGVCGDCAMCGNNLDDACFVAEKFRCAWCGHCTRRHAHRAAPGEAALQRLQREERRLENAKAGSIKADKP